MHTTHTPPVVRAVLSKLGWLAVVLAVVGGLLGMHVIGGFQALAMEVVPLASTSTTTSDTHTAAQNHHGFSSAFPRDHPVAALAVPAHQGDPMSCSGSPSEGHASMDGHDSCVPSFGPETLVVPLPGILSWAHQGTAFTSTQGPKSKGRVPDPPSLIQLSIIRT